MKVLIAEDDRTSRVVLEKYLGKWGYVPVSVTNGLEAWGVMKHEDSPRIAILDWMMPEMSGIEVCRRIRERKGTPYTYVILVTAKGQRDDIAEGYETGVDDFVVKPFDPVQLQQRLTVGVRVADYERELNESKIQLARYASEMEALAQERARHLAHAERMATLGLLAAGIAHEINNPVTYISGNAQLLQLLWSETKEKLEKDPGSSERKDGKIQYFLEEVPKFLSSITKGVERITRIVSGLKNYAAKNKTDTGPCDINQCVREALDLCANPLKYHVAVETDLAPDLPPVMGNSQEIDQVFVNLFMNAADAMKPNGEGKLHIRTFSEDSIVGIEVADTGPGLPADIVEEIWKPFFTTKGPDKGTGLGLSIVRGIIESHKGTIVAENRPAGGARFTITLPRFEPEERINGETGGLKAVQPGGSPGMP